MKTLDLEKVYNILVHISAREEVLNDRGIFNTILPHNSTDSIYKGYDFDMFVSFYSFKFFKEDIPRYSEYLLVYNDDPVPFESYTEGKFMFIPTPLLDMSSEQLDEWIDFRIIESQLQAAKEKEEDKQNIIKQIEFLQERLKAYE